MAEWLRAISFSSFLSAVFLLRRCWSSMRRHRVFSTGLQFDAIVASVTMENVSDPVVDPVLIQSDPVLDEFDGDAAESESVVDGERGEDREDVLWFEELDLTAIPDIGLQNCDFGFPDESLMPVVTGCEGGGGADENVVPGGGDETVVPVVDMAANQEVLSRTTAGDMAADQEVKVPGLRALPHPELVQAGKGKEKSASAHNDSWAVRRADQLRKSMGWNMKVALGDLPLDQLDELFSNLFARAVKVTGEEYPASTLMNMLGGFNRVIRRASEIRALNHVKSYRVEKDFNIKRDVHFTKTRMVLTAAIKKTAREGTNKKTAKVEIITEAMEEAMFADVDHQVTENDGCQKLLALLLMLRCGVRGGKELWELLRKDLSVEVDCRGEEYIKFEERKSKNNSWTLDRYQEHQFRKAFHSFEPRFLLCVKQYMRHMPPLEESEPDLFLQPISGPASIVWYNRKQKVRRDKAAGYLKNAALLVGIDPDVFTNKSGRATLITRMAARGIPDEVGMLVSGHHTTDGYLRYDRSQPIKMEAAVLVGSNPNLSYSEALAQVSKKFIDDKVVGRSDNLRPLVRAASSSTIEGSSSSITTLGRSQSNMSRAEEQGKGKAIVLEERSRGTAVAVSMREQVRGGDSQLLRVSDSAMQVRGGDNQLLRVSDSARQMVEWHRDYDGINWDEEMKNNPSLQRALGGIRGGPSQVTVGSRVGSSLAGNSFVLGSNCTINFICAKKDSEDEKENQPAN